jgi:membrane protease YdiL (CAAX protease family)
LITREGWSNTFLRPNLRRGWPYYLAAWTLPLVAIIVGGAVYYLLFPSKFDLSMQWARGTALMPPWFAKDPWWVIISQTVLDGYRTVLISMFLMLGEEFGWRAYLLPKLMPLGARKAVLLVGVIWAVFHWPFIFMGYQYRFGYWGAPVVGPLLWVVVTMFGSNVLLAWVTLRTGSVWPAAIAHGVGNAMGPIMAFFLQGEWDRLIGPSTVGIVGFLGDALLTLLIFLSSRALAPVDMALSKNPAAVEKAADQAQLGAVL